MEKQELKKLIETEKVKVLKFDGYEFEIEFENGISVTVGKDTDHDCAVWVFESNIEREKAKIEWHKRNES